jgi:hypothetical protein
MRPADRPVRGPGDSSSSWSGGGYAFNALFLTALHSFPAVGLLIAIKGRGGVISKLLLAIGVSWGIANTTAYPDTVLHARPGNLFADALAVFGSCAWLPAIGMTGTFLMLLFPDGRLPGSRWRWVGWVSAVSITVGTLTILLTPGQLDQTGYPNTANPLGIEAIGGILDSLRLIILAVALIPARVRRAGRVQTTESTVSPADGDRVAPQPVVRPSLTLDNAGYDKLSWKAATAGRRAPKLMPCASAAPDWISPRSSAPWMTRTRLLMVRPSHRAGGRW